MIAALRSKCSSNSEVILVEYMYKDIIHCPLQCDKENPHLNTQEHLLTCKQINITNEDNLNISSVFVTSQWSINHGQGIGKNYQSNSGTRAPPTGWYIITVKSSGETEYFYQSDTSMHAERIK